MQEEGLTMRHVGRSREIGNACMIVEIGGNRILVNLGTGPDLDVGIYDNIEEALRGVTHILLCSGEVSCTGGLPFLKRLGKSIPVVGTVPIKILGRIEALERNRIMSEFEDTEIYSEKDIDEAFDRMVPLKYLQSYDLDGDVSVVPMNSGNSVGGCIWKIQRRNEGYFVLDRVNHRKEMHLDGLEIPGLKDAGSVFVNARIVRKTKTTKKERDVRIIELMDRTLGRNGIVFIPTTYSRFLEVVLVLDEYLKKDTRGTRAKMCLFSFYGQKYVDSVKTILEWTGSAIVKKFNQVKENPFLLHTLNVAADLRKGIPPEYKVIFTIDEEGIRGFSKAILPLISGRQENLILRVQGEGSAPGIFGKEAVDLQRVEYIDLGQDEIAEFRRQEKEQLEKKRAEDAINELIRKKREESSEEEEEERGKLIHKFWHEVQDEILVTEHLEGALAGPKGANRPEFCLEDTEVRFPNPQRRRHFDDYGEPITIKKEEQEAAESHEEVREEKRGQETRGTPYKMVTREPQRIEIKCEFADVDFTGESDMSSVKTILDSMKVGSVVVHGESPDDRNILSAYLTLGGCCEKVLCLHDALDLESKSAFLTVRLSDELLGEVEMETLGTGSIGFFRSRITSKNSKIVFEKAELGEEEMGEEQVCLGKIKLGEMRREFAEEGFKAEIVNDKLVVNERIMVHLDQGNLYIEGDLCREFYAVKRVVSRNIALVALRSAPGQKAGETTRAE